MIYGNLYFCCNIFIFYILFVNKNGLFHFSYERYLVNCIRNNFGLEGTPVRIMVREKNDDEK